MARSDLVIKLLKASLANDQRQTHKIAEMIIAEERKKQHHTFAERLEKALLSTTPYSNVSSNTFFRSGYKNGNGNVGNVNDFIAEIKPQRRFEDLILSSECLELCQEIVEEQHRADVLRSHGLEPRHRILFVGPPGNGKTSLAESMAFEIGATFFVVRYETVIGSFLGETSARLKRIFDYARTRPCVLFFDEFDTLGKERGDTHETGEIKRVVSSLLLQIDELPSYTLVISATNHPELLDRAVWRRFQVRLDLPLPTRQQLELYFSKFLMRFNEDPGYEASTLAKHLFGYSFSETEDFCLNIQRRYILSMGESTIKTIIAAQIKHWKSQFSVCVNNAN